MSPGTVDPATGRTPLADRVLHRWPLRYSVPSVLVLGAVLALVANLVWAVVVVDSGVMRTGRDELRTDVDVAAASFARHRDAGHRDAASDVVATLESDPRITFAVILDANGLVSVAHDRRLIGRRATDGDVLPAASARTAVARALATAASREPGAPPAVEEAPGYVLVAALRVRLRPGAASTDPAGPTGPAVSTTSTRVGTAGPGDATGTILVLHAMSPRIRFERDVIVRSMVPLVVVMLGSTVLLWAIFDVVIGRRLARLADAARRVADGERDVQSGVAGTDEVGGLAAAFDRMATEIDARVDRREADLAVVEDRERIARDLHDHVIQRLFATGLALQAVSSRVDERAAGRLRSAVEDLDDTIREIRTTIFGLHRHEQGVRADVLEVVAEYREVLGFLPETRFEGSLDTLVGGDVRDHLLATLREALSNVARHAHANRVRVAVRVGTEVEVEVSDDGVGIPTPAVRSSGLANLERRAASLGGGLDVRRGTVAGTVLSWRVPVHAPDPARDLAPDPVEGPVEDPVDAGAG